MVRVVLFDLGTVSKDPRKSSRLPLTAIRKLDLDGPIAVFDS